MPKSNLKEDLKMMMDEETGEGEAPVKKGKHKGKGKLAKPKC